MHSLSVQDFINAAEPHWQKHFSHADEDTAVTGPLPTIALIGGTGNLGQGLGLQFALRGHPIVIGSRDAAKAETSARQLEERSGKAIRGLGNAEAAAAGDIVVLTVPWAPHPAPLAAIRVPQADGW